MQGFIDSFKPFLTRYLTEVILLSCAFLIGLTSIVLYYQQKTNEKSVPIGIIKNETRNDNQKKTLTVDVSGAVKNPFVYTLPVNARIIDAIEKAGGISPEADEAFVKRNVNYARIMSDQEKIYIPFLSDTTNGYVLENKRVIDYVQPNTVAHVLEESTHININTASVIELDQLPGIGKVMAEAIFNGRPYISMDDLVVNNIIKKTVYEKIRNQISLY